MLQRRNYSSDLVITYNEQTYAARLVNFSAVATPGESTGAPSDHVTVGHQSATLNAHSSLLLVVLLCVLVPVVVLAIVVTIVVVVVKLRQVSCTSIFIIFYR